MTSRKIQLAFISLLLFGFASNDTPETMVAETLMNLTDFRQALAVTVGSNVPPGIAAELAQSLIEQDQQFWGILEADLSSAMREQIVQKELVDLSQQYREDPAQAWTDSHEMIAALFQALASSDTKVSRYLKRFGCQVGFLAGPLETAFEQARASGGTPTLTPEVVEQVSRLMGPTASTCDCIFEKLVEKHGEEILLDRSLGAEKATTIKELLISGQCKDPFAQFSADSQE